MAIQTSTYKLERDELERNLGGPMPTGSILLLEGHDGGGKSVLAQRLCYGFIKNKKKVSYVSTELSLIGFIQQMDSLAYRITNEVIAEDLIFISMFPQLGNVHLKKTFMDDLLKSKKIFSTDVIIFDTISFLIISDSLGEENIFLLISFLKKISAMEKSIILCIDPDQCNKRFLDLIRNIADIYLQSEAKEVLGNMLHVLSIVRYKKSPQEVVPATPFKILPGAGFAIELASLA